MKNNKGKHKGKNTMRTAEETVKLVYFSSKRGLQHGFHRRLFLYLNESTCETMIAK